MKKIGFILTIGFSWAIGLKALTFPVDARSLAVSGTGIAYGNNINPAAILSGDTKQLSFTRNQWLKGILGANIEHQWQRSYISLQSARVDDLELWGEVPNTDPLGEFGVSWISARFGKGLLLKNSFQLGLEIQLFNSRLYTQQTSGLSSTIGFRYLLSQNVIMGGIVKGLGYLESDLDEVIPMEYGFGAAVSLMPLSSWVIIDISYHSDLGEIYKFALETKVKYLTFNVGVNQMPGNRYLSGGMKFRYRQWSVAYGLLTQQTAALGNPQSLQITLHY